ncbi:MAG: TetR/AcrR family transcriptional regulator [Myxococcota bacterium]
MPPPASIEVGKTDPTDNFSTAASDEKTAPLGRRERRKLEVHERIYSTARDLFAKQGFDATTVDEIAEAADVAPATFFNHFKSKQTLLGLMTGEVFEYLHAMTKEHLEGEGSSREKLRRFMVAATLGIESNRGVARDVLLEFMRTDGTPEGPHPYLERLVEPFVELVQEGQRKHEFRNDHDAAFLTQMALGMMNSAITSWLTNPDFPVETGLVDATDFALQTLQASHEQ